MAAFDPLTIPAEFQLDPMTVGDYDEVLTLWNACEGVRANESKEELAKILERNPGLCTVVRRGGALAAAVLCCHDGRRGYLYHLGVAPPFRELGLGRLLVQHSLDKLKEVGIGRCSIFLVVGNQSGETFWKRLGWRERTDLKAFARDF